MTEKKGKVHEEENEENNLDESHIECDDSDSMKQNIDNDGNEANSEKKAEENSEEKAEEKAKENTEKKEENEREELIRKLTEKQKESQEYLDMLRHTMADFDNYRKRTNKEKESVYDDGFSDAIKAILPVLDNLERAVNAGEEENSPLFEGLKMVLKIFYDILGKSGISEIKAEGEKFNPDFHNAVMHIEDDSFEENTIAEVLQKGFMYKDKVLRHSMVKVAN